MLTFLVGFFSWSKTNAQPLEVALLPVGEVDSLPLSIAEEAINRFFEVKVTLLPPIPYQDSMFCGSWNDNKSQPIQVVSALAIYHKLSEINDQNNQFDVIIGLTEDAMIGEEKMINPSTQLMRGLGGAPHRVAIVSSYKVNQESKNAYAFRGNLSKVVNHEFGHILGLEHCTDSKHCLMLHGQHFHHTIPEFCSSCLQKIDKKYLKM